MLKPPRSKGFTLVELAVVLIIIGLLTSGVLVGQSLIQSARTKAIIDEIEQHQLNIVAFEEQYYALPGDMVDATSVLDAGTANGDGNGLIVWNDGVGATDPQEGALAWRHLELARFIESGNLSGEGPDAVIGVNVPESAANNGGYYLHSDVALGNFLGVGAINPAGGVNNEPALSSLQAYNIDEKIDDGIGNTGAVRGEGASCHSGGAYNVTSDAIVCAVQVRLMARVQ